MNLRLLKLLAYPAMALALLAACAPAWCADEAADDGEKTPRFKFDNSLEYEISRRGTDLSLPQTFSYALSKQLAVSGGPVVHPYAHPDRSPELGDLGSACTGLIGSGRTDFGSSLQYSREWGRFAPSLSLGAASVRSVRGQSDPRFAGGLGTEYHLGGKTRLFGECTVNPAAPSAIRLTHFGRRGEPGGALDGTAATLGVRYQMRDDQTFSLALSQERVRSTWLRGDVSLKF